MAKKSKSEAKKNTKKEEAKQPDNGRQKAVQIAMKQIEKEFGKGSIMKMNESLENIESIPAIPTGSISLDLALGVGGYPKGRIVEIYGPEASGKTTLCLHAIAETQKQGGVAAFIDVEHALDPVRADNIGVNLDDLLISQPDYGEQALEIAETLIRSGGVDVVVIDSVAALVPKSEIEGEMGDTQVGVQARLMSQAMRKLAAAINKTNTLVIFTNQIRMKIGIMFGSPETTSGGQALKFYASQRLDIRRIGSIKEGDEVVGSRHRVKVKKNKVAPPFKTSEFDMDEMGISRSGDVLDIGLKYGILERSGSFYKYNDEVIAQGREATKEEFEQKPKLMKEIESKIWDKINNNGKKKGS
ncbi:MAG: recombinase RecA [Candidatus Pacebacteria bacterium]|nr:recombinase RecA [Candidatus Paceibacterota bacterium]